MTTYDLRIPFWFIILLHSDGNNPFSAPSIINSPFLTRQSANPAMCGEKGISDPNLRGDGLADVSSPGAQWSKPHSLEEREPQGMATTTCHPHTSMARQIRWEREPYPKGVVWIQNREYSIYSRSQKYLTHPYHPNPIYTHNSNFNLSTSIWTTHRYISIDPTFSSQRYSCLYSYRSTQGSTQYIDI